MSIELINISKSYVTRGHRKSVFKNLNLHVPHGLNLGVIGPNGSGKSTLLNMIAGGLNPDRGRIVRRMTVSWPVGFGGGAATNLSGIANCRFIARLYGKDPEEVVRFVSDFTELEEFMHWPVKTYSSGMRSRLNFALSMAVDFDCTLVDEAMGAGDQFFRSKAEAMINERRKKSSFIMVTHNLEEVISMCDRVLVLGGVEPLLSDDVKARVDEYYYAMTQLRKEKAQSEQPMLVESST
jgi:capsular polysaccharide transport system ATP-binding protein